MARGYFSGLIAGALVSALGLGGISVLVGAPEQKRPQTGEPTIPAGSEFGAPRNDDAVALPQANDGSATPSAPQVSAPEPDSTATMDLGVTEPATQPETGQAQGTLGEPQAGAEQAGISVDSETPVLPSPQAEAPEQPASEESLSISTDPAQPDLPEPVEDSAFPDMDTTEQEEAAQVEEAQVEEAPVEEAPVEETPVEEAPVEEAATPPDPAEQPDIALATPELQAEPAPDESPDANAEAPAQDDTAGSSSIIGNLAPEVTTNRLPSVGDSETAETSDETADQSEMPAAEDDLPPLQRFAAEFENPEGKPLMSIILIDDGSSAIDVQALQSFPYPLTFAVETSWTGAEDAMNIYRASGFEVIAMMDLPEGAGPQDTEVAMQSILARLPEIVAVMEGTGSGLQSSRAAAEQLAPILLESGHGAVFFPKGLNTAQQLLAREGVPAVSVFRDFDANGQSATVIRRFLDQAAFKAAQEEAGVVMVGRLRPETVSALLLWGLQDRATRVSIAPISAIMLGK